MNNKLAKYARMPMHLRWELYPVAHETERKYGGSYLEEIDWQKKPYRPGLKGLLADLMYTIKEIVTFEKNYQNNFDLWRFVYPFHIGIWLLIIWFVLIFVGALTQICGMPIEVPPRYTWAQIVFYATMVIGIISLVLGTFSSCALLIKRGTGN